MTQTSSTTVTTGFTVHGPAKRRRVVLTDSSAQLEDDIVIRHPLGVRPSGNAFVSRLNLRHSIGDFALLPDEVIALVLEGLEIHDLLILGGTCRALHAFCRNDELWRSLFVESPPKSPFTWQGTWRSTLLRQSQSKEPVVDCSNLFSDLLHRPFFCAHVPLNHFAQSIPKANEIARLENLSIDAFQDEWFAKPFILTAPVREWPVYRAWDVDRLLQDFHHVSFRAESVDWPLRTYVEYMRGSQDESPLYLFDRSFAEKMSLEVSSEPKAEASYWPPTCFGFDAFTVLGKDRPDHRWLIVGPARSGSTFHQDPNATSAWNAVIRGSKYWIMFRASPSIPPPPGVFVSEDRSEVTSPLSIAEWLLGYHSEARRTPGCMEGICNEGEVLHVPSGWYHLVLNLEASVAITQNFVPRSRLGAVLQFLRDQKPSISGFGADIEDPYQLFVDKLREHDENLLEQGLKDLEVLSKPAKTKWDDVTKLEDADSGDSGFSFAFGNGSDEEDVP